MNDETSYFEVQSKPLWTVSIGEKTTITTIKIEGRGPQGPFEYDINSEHIENFIGAFKTRAEYLGLRDKYLVIGIKNLLKKFEFVQLALQLAENQITPEDFEKELDTHAERYLLKYQSLNDKHHLTVISDIISSVGRDLNVDEVADIFSIEPKSIEKHLTELGI